MQPASLIKRKGGWGVVKRNIPTSEAFALSSCEFRLASFLRLGLPLSLSNWTTTCNCGADIDDSGYHLLTCKTGGGPVWSHESISSIWSDCFRKLHIHHRREPRNRYTTTDNRPDIIFFDSDTGSISISTCISLAHPWSSDIFSTSAGVDGAAVDRRADRKRAKYNKQQLPGGSIVSAIPLVMEHFGAWGFDAWKFFKKIAKKSSDEVGRLNAAKFIDFWSKRFSIQLQECNANVISKKSSSLTGVDRSDFYATQFFSH